MRSDRAAKGVAGELDMQEEEVCEMHDTEKLGQSATGGLVRTRKKVAVNPFPEGVDLVQRAHKLGAYFGYSTQVGAAHRESGKYLVVCLRSRSRSTTTRRASPPCTACCTPR